MAGAVGGINVSVPQVVNQTDRVEAAAGGCVTAAREASDGGVLITARRRGWRDERLMPRVCLS